VHAKRMKHCASPEVVRLPEALIYVQQQRVSVRHCTHNLGPLFEPAASIIYSTHTSQAVEGTGQPCSKSAHHSALLSAHTALRVSRDGCCRVCANTGYCSSLLLSLCVGRKAKMATLSQCKWLLAIATQSVLLHLTMGHSLLAAHAVFTQVCHNTSSALTSHSTGNTVCL
jgi:hypothetical protein